MQYVVRVTYESDHSDGLVTSEDVYRNGEAATLAFETLRDLGSTVSGSLMREVETDGQYHNVILDMFTRGALV